MEKASIDPFDKVLPTDASRFNSQEIEFVNADGSPSRPGHVGPKIASKENGDARSRTGSSAGSDSVSWEQVLTTLMEKQLQHEQRLESLLMNCMNSVTHRPLQNSTSTTGPVSMPGMFPNGALQQPPNVVEEEAKNIVGRTPPPAKQRDCGFGTEVSADTNEEVGLKKVLQERSNDIPGIIPQSADIAPSPVHDNVQKSTSKDRKTKVDFGPKDDVKEFSESCDMDTIRETKVLKDDHSNDQKGPSTTQTKEVDPDLKQTFGSTALQRMQTWATEVGFIGNRGYTLHRLPSMETAKRCRGWLWLRHQAHTLAGLRRFELVTVVIIVFNALMIGWHVDWSVRNIGAAKTPEWFQNLNLTFTIFFTLELSVRMLDEGAFFIHCRNRKFRWNVFDSCIVATALAEEIFMKIQAMSANDQLADVSAIRALRILRLVRIFRIIRVMRFFSDLRVMVQCITSSMRSLMWLILLLMLLTFLVGVCVMQICTTKLEELHAVGDTNSDFSRALLFHFGSVFRTIYTLYQAITSGVDWGEVSELLVEISPIMGLVFSVYIAFAVLCVLNIVTGVFVENANRITQMDTDSMVMEELHMRQQWLVEVRRLFSSGFRSNRQTARVTTGHGDGFSLASKQSVIGGPEEEEMEEIQMTLDLWKEYIQKPAVQAAFRKIGLFVHNGNAEALFALLDFDNSGTVDVEEFVEGCTQLVGSASQLDIARLHHEVRCVLQEVQDLHYAYTCGGDKRETQDMSRISFASSVAGNRGTMNRKSRKSRQPPRQTRAKMSSMA